MSKKFWMCQLAQLIITVFLLHIITVENTRRFDILDNNVDYIKFLCNSNYEGIWGHDEYEKSFWNKDGHFESPYKGWHKGIIQYLRDIQSGNIKGDENGFIPASK